MLPLPAQALVRLRKRGTKIASAAMLAVAAREIGLLSGRGARLEHRLRRSLPRLDGEPIELAFRALQGHDAALRGTALEYLTTCSRR